MSGCTEPKVIGQSPADQAVDRQVTLAASIKRQGVGLHTGLETCVVIQPAEVGSGRYFVRTDLPNQPLIPAQVEAVYQTTLSTELKQGDASIRTVEHLLSALAGLGIDNARIEIDGPELPLLDGSALVWAQAIVEAGRQVQPAPQVQPILQVPLSVTQGDAFVAAMPSPKLRFTYGIEFDLSAIGNQWHSWCPGTASLSTAPVDSYLQDIAPARTFGLAHQIEYLQAQGLIRGGSLENALVCGPEGWINPPLRFSNEPARHKLLDLIGDLSLVGALPTAHYVAFKASHQLHTQFVRSLVAHLYT